MKILILLLMPMLALAWDDPEQVQDQAQDQAQLQTASAAATASSEQAQDNVQQTTFEGGAPDIVMVPNNNTEPCLRVIGIMFSGTSGGAGIGWPYRSKLCDYEAAADDAFAQGQIDIGWFWKCQNKNLHKKFGSPELCHMSMISMLERPREAPQTKPTAPTPLTVNCNDGQHDDKHDKIFEACQYK